MIFFALNCNIFAQSVIFTYLCDRFMTTDRHIEKYVTAAERYFSDGFNCAQAVFAAYE